MPEDGRRTADGEKGYSLTQIWDIHHEIVRMLALGFKPKMIAEQLQITEQTVSNVRNNPLVKQRLTELQLARDASVMEVRKQVAELVPKAIKVLDDVMESDAARNSDKLRAALGILDNTLPRQSNIQHSGGVVTTEDIREILDRGRNKVEAEYEVEEVEDE